MISSPNYVDQEVSSEYIFSRHTLYHANYPVWSLWGMKAFKSKYLRFGASYLHFPPICLVVLSHGTIRNNLEWRCFILVNAGGHY